MAEINSRDEILKLLKDITDFYGTYHNNKETSAWGGLVLALFFVMQIVNVAVKELGVAANYHCNGYRYCIWFGRWCISERAI
jgi:hypothetical protein